MPQKLVEAGETPNLSNLQFLMCFGSKVAQLAAAAQLLSLRRNANKNEFAGRTLCF